MPRLSFPQRIAALGLAATLSLPWASAAPPVRQDYPSARRAAAPESLIQQLLSLWADLWSPFQTTETLDEGCHADPNGRCAIEASHAAPGETLDEGCHLDPSGSCGIGASHAAPAENLDAGCHLDPSGVCVGGS